MSLGALSQLGLLWVNDKLQGSGLLCVRGKVKGNGFVGCGTPVQY